MTVPTGLLTCDKSRPQPQSGAAVKSRIAAKAGASAFFRDCFEFAAGESVPTWVVWPAFKWWCQRNGEADLLERNPNGSLLSKELSKTVEGWTGEKTVRVHGTDRRYAGLRLRNPEGLSAALDEAEKQRARVRAYVVGA